MIHKKSPVGILPLGRVPEPALKIIAAHVCAFFHLPADILSPREQPDFALDRKRIQYNAGIILSAMSSSGIPGYGKIIGIIDLDIFVPIFSFCFGEARQGGDHALVSLFRLARNPDGSPPAAALFYERAAKVALHELGHLFNLFHCEEKKCLMHFSGGIQDLDQTPVYLCRYCSSFLKG